MERKELVEWLGLIAVIVAWWPPLFLGWYPLPYRILLPLFSIVVVGIITLRRVRRFRESLRFHREMMDLLKRRDQPPGVFPPGMPQSSPTDKPTEGHQLRPPGKGRPTERAEPPDEPL